MGRQRRIHRPVTPVFPPDFPARLERFKAAGGVSWRALARRLGVSPYRLREWRRGTVPSAPHLFVLLTLADQLGLIEVLMCPERDLPDPGMEPGGPPAP
ncbi:MAG: helix-turn-helix transcriptional regulator [Chloroflexi bacterium]|nr:helix-turn-helix transcriptional regulator [Chloroflexota bacterium]